MPQLSPLAKQQFFDTNGNPLASGKLYTYITATSTPKTTYSDNAATPTANANPIILDSRGEASIWLDSDAAYRFTLKDSADALIWTKDDITTTLNLTPVVVSTIAALKALTSGSYPTAQVLGYYAAGDGGGGLFRWNSSDSTTDNGGTVIRPDSAPSTGRWNRVYDSALNVRWFGAKGDGSTDDAAAFNSAIALATGQAIYAPVGTYRFASQLTVANQPIVLNGEDAYKTILYWNIASGGISYSTTTEGHIVELRNLTFRTNQAGGGTAFAGTWPASLGSSALNTFIAENVHLQGSTLSTNYWTKGFSITNAWNARVSGFHSVANASPGFGGSAAIELLGDSNAALISNFHILHGDRGIKVGGTSEGTQIFGGEIVGSQVGIDMTTAAGEPGTSITGVHVNTYSSGIILAKRTYTSIVGCFLLKPATNTSWTGIASSSGSDRARIVGNVFDASLTTGGTNVGINLNAATYNTVTGNHLSTLTTGINLENVATNNIITGNQMVSCTTLIADTGSSNLAFGNTVSYVTGAGIGDYVLPYQGVLQSVNAAGAALQPIVKHTKSAANVQQTVIGGGYSGGSFANIVAATAVNLPAAAATENGIIALDTTNNRLAVYISGNRYYITPDGTF